MPKRISFDISEYAFERLTDYSIQENRSITNLMKDYVAEILVKIEEANEASDIEEFLRD